jgi:hypothetical protein
VNVIWLIVALVMWPIVSILVGLLLGRVLAGCRSRAPQPMPELWTRPALPGSVVATSPPGREHQRRVS